MTADGTELGLSHMSSTKRQDGTKHSQIRLSYKLSVTSTTIQTVPFVPSCFRPSDYNEC